MTVVAALKTSTGVLMGADRMADEGGRREPMAVSKIIRHHGLLIGVSGSSRWLHRLRHWGGFPMPPEDPDHFQKEAWLNTVFSDAVRQLATDTGMLLQSEHKGADADLNLLIAWGKDIFCMARNFEINQISRNCHAIGSGRDECMGALLALDFWDDGSRMNRALDITAECVIGIESPFDLEFTDV